MWNLNLHFKCNIFHLNGIVSHTSKLILQVSTFIHVLEHCIHLIATSCFVCRVEVEPEQEVTPSAEDPEPEPRQQGKQTPIDHVDKIPLPSHVLLMHCLG